MPVVQSQCPDGEVALNTLLETQSSGQAKTSPSAEEDSVGSVISSDDKSFVVYSMYAARASFVAGASNSKNGREGYKSGHYIIICAQLSYPLSRGNVHIRSASTMDKRTIDPNSSPIPWIWNSCRQATKPDLPTSYRRQVFHGRRFERNKFNSYVFKSVSLCLSAFAILDDLCSTQS